MNKKPETIATVKKRELYFREHVGEDASVRLEKNQNRNNIKIIDEHKSSVVGKAALGDPKEKHKFVNKLTSNIPTSNIKIPTSNSAITLIALIITIIVLLILAGVTLNMVMGKNGIFGKANIAKEKTNKSTARETIELKVAEYKTVAASEGKNCTIQGFCEYIINNEDISTVEQTETSVIAINNGYGFLLNEKLIITEELGIYVAKTDATYVVKSINNNTANVTITMKNNSGIKKITKPNGESLIPTDNSIEIEYEITVGNEYIFKVQNSDDKEEDYTLKYTNESKPEIIDDGTTGAYPVLTSTGVTSSSKTVKIDYGDSEGQHYYSTDNGSTWNVYENPVSISKKCTIMAKSKSNNNVIQKIDKKDVEASAAADAITSEAFDGNEDTFIQMHQNITPGTNTRYILIDSSMRGKKVGIKWWNWYYGGYYSTITFMDSDDNSLTTYTLPANTTACEVYNIPNKAYKMKYFVRFADSYWSSEDGFGKLYEIVPNAEEITAQYTYPKITSEGIKKSGITLAVNGQNEIQYKINDNEWKKYENNVIEINKEDTLYAKSEKSFITKFTYLISDAVGSECFDDDNTNYFTCSGARYIEVEDSAINKKININIQNGDSSYPAYLNLLGENDEILASYRLYDGENEITLISGTKKIKYTPYNAYGSLDKLFSIKIID